MVKVSDLDKLIKNENELKEDVLFDFVGDLINHLQDYIEINGKDTIIKLLEDKNEIKSDNTS